MMKVLSWNSTGVGKPSKLAALRDLINQEKPEIILLQETKQGDLEMKTIMEKMKHYGGTLSESRGASGGLATLWNHSIWKYKDTTVKQNWIKVILECARDQEKIIVYNVYGPNHYRDKEIYWNSLKE